MEFGGHKIRIPNSSQLEEIMTQKVAFYHFKSPNFKVLLISLVGFLNSPDECRDKTENQHHGGI